jgi:hypothetical protein
MKRRVDIAGISVEVAARDASRWEAVEVLFGDCLGSSEPPALVVEHQVSAPDLPDSPADETSSELEVWLDPEGVAARHSSGACARRFGDRIVVGGWTPGIESVRAFRMATQPPLIDALGHHGRHTLHAASLERDGSAILVLGGSGAGKSTFAFAGSQGGWRIITDDLSLVGVNDVAHVSGLPKPVNVPSDALDSPPEGSRLLPNDERQRWALPSSAIAARGKYPVRAVVMLGHSADAAEVTETPASPARLERLIASLPLGAMPSAVRAFFPVAARLSRLPAYTYMHPFEPAERMPAVVDLLRALWTDLGERAQ